MILILCKCNAHLGYILRIAMIDLPGSGNRSGKNRYGNINKLGERI